MRAAVVVVAAIAALACGAPSASPPRAPLRRFYVSASAPPCAEDDGALGASLAALRFDDGDEGGDVLTPPRSVIVRATSDCMVTTRRRSLRLSSSEPLAEACADDDRDGCPFVRACWARGGPSDAACTGGDRDRVAELFEILASGDPPMPGLFERDPAGSADAATVYVETGTHLYGQGHLVQRIEGAWRVVLSMLVWQA